MVGGAACQSHAKQGVIPCCVCDVTQAVPALTYPHLESHQAWDRVLGKGLQAYVEKSPYFFGLRGERLERHLLVAGVAWRSMQHHQRLVATRQRPVSSIARGCRVQQRCSEPSVAIVHGRRREGRGVLWEPLAASNIRTVLSSELVDAGPQEVELVHPSDQPSKRLNSNAHGHRKSKDTP